jgi:hypothetical protein
MFCDYAIYVKGCGFSRTVNHSLRKDGTAKAVP